MKINPCFQLAAVVTLFISLAAPSSLRADTYPNTVLGAGPAAYWRFETVNDTSLTNGYVNTFIGNATVTAAGQGVPLTGVANNRALLLDGDGDSVQTGVSNQLTFASSGTFMAWVNFNQLPGTAGRTIDFVVKSHFNSPLELLMDENNRLIGYAGDYTTTYYDANPAFVTNTWYHIAYTFSNAGGFKRLYVNGVLVADLALNPNLTGSTDEITLGNSSVFTDRSFNGRMDEVALFNRALTTTEIQTIFASGGVSTPAPQPVVRLGVEITREVNALSRGANEYWGVGINFQISPTPFGSTNAVYSTHTNHSSVIGGPTGNITGGGYIYGTFAEAVSEATNGLWTVILHQGEPSQQIYQFKLSSANLTMNNFANITVTSPVDDSVGNAADVPFTWTESTPWPLATIELSGSSTFVTKKLPAGATSWTNAPSLGLGRYDLNLYLRTNASQWISMTTPTNGSGALPNWDASAQLQSRRGIRFRVGYFIPPPPGLQAHLRFDDQNYLGLDSSGSNNNANSSWYDQPPTYNANGKVGGAASFTHGGWLEFAEAFTPTLGGDFTVAVWVQTTQVAGNDTDQGIDGAGIVGGYIGDYSAKNTAPIVLNGSKAGFMTGDQNGEQTLHSTTNINAGGPGWVHVAVTRVQATGEKRIYINGVLDASETGNTLLLDGTEAVRVGYGDFFTYNGLLDDLQIYSASLSAADIAYLYANPGEEVANVMTLGTAVDASQLTWTSGGNASWFAQTTNTHDNVAAAQSGDINDNEESWIETTVTGPGTLSFWWKVSSEDAADYLEFLIDGSTQTDMSGEVDWQQENFAIAPGTHTLRWNYYKDGSLDNGLDAGFLDQVSYVPTTPPNTNLPPVITINPFSQTNYPGYNVGLLAAATSNLAITWQWFKVGSPTPIANATNGLFIPANSGTAGVAGSYFAIVTNNFGSATSSVATVTFQTAPLPPDWSRAFASQFNNNPAFTTADINLASLIDSAGNIITVGSVSGTNVFGTNTLATTGNEETSFLKQTATGTPIWGRSMTNNGSGNSFPRSLASGPGDGFYACGFFSGTNWLGTNKLVDTAGGSTYLARFDTSGSNLWVRTIVGTNFNFPTHHTLVSDPAGNVTLSVLISGYTSFGSTNVEATGQKGALAQYDLNGNLRWVQLPSAWPDYLAYSAGRIYGSMGGTDTNYIGGITNTSDRRRTLFALNATNGQALWIRSFAAGKDEGSPSGFGSDSTLVAVSGTNIFVSGTSYGPSASFGPYTVNFPNGAGQYFARFDTNGTPQLATTFGSKYSWLWAAVADAAGNVYVGADFDIYAIFGSKVIAAPFYETVQFVNNIENRIPGQAFVAKFDRDGNALWARSAQSPSSYLNLRDLTLAADGIWACGFFNPIGNFANLTIYGGTSPYHRSGYLAKITDGATSALPVTLLNPQRVGTNFQFQFVSQNGFTHDILYRTNLVTGLERTNASILGDGSTKTATVPLSIFNPASQGFIRVSTH